jgi:hypothetical protein
MVPLLPSRIIPRGVRFPRARRRSDFGVGIVDEEVPGVGPTGVRGEASVPPKSFQTIAVPSQNEMERLSRRGMSASKDAGHRGHVPRVVLVRAVPDRLDVPVRCDRHPLDGAQAGEHRDPASAEGWVK